VAAVVGVAAFAYVASAVLAVDRGALAGAAAQQTRTRLEAAADAGLALALHGLGQPGGTERWSLDARPVRTSFDGVALTVVVEDEYGKAPLGRLTEAQARRLFEAAGVRGARLDTLTDAFLDWTDGDDEPRPAGSEDAAYADRGLRSRDAPALTIEELAELRGMDPATLAALAPAVTVWADRGFFAETYAHPVALAAMTEGGADSPAVIQRRRERAGQVAALPAGEPVRLTGRPLTIRVVAEDGQGGRFERSAVVQLTGRPEAPYRVRQLD
jgi:general secretion pathway protein K